MSNDRLKDPTAYGEAAGSRGTTTLRLDAGAELAIEVKGWPPGKHHQTEVVIIYTGWPPGQPQRYVVNLSTGWPPGGPKESVARPADRDPDNEREDELREND